MDTYSNRLVLGTAQFGFRYGVSNTKGLIPKEEISHILTLAHNHRIDTLDTAMNYGESEKAIGESGIGEFKIITKLPKYNFTSNEDDIKLWVNNNVKNSMIQLNTKFIYGILFHCPEDLLGNNGNLIFKYLNEFKKNGLISKIGVSVYDYNNLEIILKKYNIDIVQAPLNIIDQRLIKSGWLIRLKNNNIDVHVRSIFLQGLILMKFQNRPQYFSKWKNLWTCLDNIMVKSRKSALELSLDFVNQFSLIDKIIVGVQNPTELIEIISIINNGNQSVISDQILCHDPNLINPTLWKASA